MSKNIVIKPLTKEEYEFQGKLVELINTAGSHLTLMQVYRIQRAILVQTICNFDKPRQALENLITFFNDVEESNIIEDFNKMMDEHEN